MIKIFVYHQFYHSNPIPFICIGMIIAIVIILAIFFISTIGGQILFFLLLLLFVIITMCVALICWIDYRKRELKKYQLSSTLEPNDNCHLYGIRFISLSDQV